MDFIERLFGVAPDRGDGSFEALIILVVALALVALYYQRRRRGAAAARESFAREQRGDIR